MEKVSIIKVLFAFILFFSETVHASSPSSLKRLQEAYPDQVKEVSGKFISCKDGTRILIQGWNPLYDHLIAALYHVDKSLGSISSRDVNREHYEAFFKKIYGHSHEEVKKKLVVMYWMPRVFGSQYPLKVTTVNGVDRKLRRVSDALEKLPSSYHKFLAHPAGSFYWRRVLGESYLSTHSFGIAIDINPAYSSYWLWDSQRLKRPMRELVHHNRIPMKIVEIFEKEGFFWGGHWYYYDTMHFEYRPDLLLANK